MSRKNLTSICHLQEMGCKRRGGGGRVGVLEDGWRRERFWQNVSMDRHCEAKFALMEAANNFFFKRLS